MTGMTKAGLASFLIIGLFGDEPGPQRINHYKMDDTQSNDAGMDRGNLLRSKWWSKLKLGPAFALC